jgi:FtsP/CotA-like multicopper oxidase with cupredoxin domain
MVVAAFLVVCGLALMLVLPQMGVSQTSDERVIYMAAIEPKGGVTVDKEPFPTTPLPKGGGYVLNPPNPQGRWEVSTYQWAPSTIVVRQGERVTLQIVGINGAKHSGHIDRYVPKHFTVKRGEIIRVQFTADTPGIFQIHCEEHEPSMEGTLLVLPR